MQKDPWAPVAMLATMFMWGSVTCIVQPARPGSPGSCTPSPFRSLNLNTQSSAEHGGVGVGGVGVRVSDGVGDEVRVRVWVGDAVRVGGGVLHLPDEPEPARASTSDWLSARSKSSTSSIAPRNACGLTHAAPMRRPTNGGGGLLAPACGSNVRTTLPSA